MNDVIADMYPVNIPPPSRVGSYTYGRFLTETPIIRDARYKRLAISKIERDMDEFKQMRLQSDMRNPPLDERGDDCRDVDIEEAMIVLMSQLEIC